MKSKIFLSLAVGVLAVMVAPLVMTGANASIENNSPDSNEGLPVPVERGFTLQDGDPNRVLLEHINQAQAALQNGDTEGANNHLELAKQSLQGNQTNSGQ